MLVYYSDFCNCRIEQTCGGFGGLVLICFFLSLYSKQGSAISVCQLDKAGPEKNQWEVNYLRIRVCDTPKTKREETTKPSEFFRMYKTFSCLLQQKQHLVLAMYLDTRLRNIWAPSCLRKRERHKPDILADLQAFNLISFWSNCLKTGPALQTGWSKQQFHC